jgi:hypothetical protein
MSTQSAYTTDQMFKQNPEYWHKYHDSRDISFQGYEQKDIPVNKIIEYLKKIEQRSKKVKIADLGCGRNKIYEVFRESKYIKVTGYDYISYNNSKSINILDIDAKVNKYNICIFCQSLMGVSWMKYIDKTYELLKYNGEIIISDSCERYDIIRNYILSNNDLIIIKDECDKNDKYINRWFYLHIIINTI